jgi:hypothetical protein
MTTIATILTDAMSNVVGKGSTMVKNNVSEAIALPAKSVAYKVTLCIPFAKPVKVKLPAKV